MEHILINYIVLSLFVSVIHSIRIVSRDNGNVNINMTDIIYICVAPATLLLVHIMSNKVKKYK